MASTVPKFLEEFALKTKVEERQSLLKKLVPGSKDAYYYESLVLLQKLEHILQQRDIDLKNVPIELNEEEIQIFEEAKRKITEGSARDYQEVETQLKMRFHLLSYPIDPVATCKFLMQKFGLESNPLGRSEERFLESGSLVDNDAVQGQYPSELDPNYFSESKLLHMIQTTYLDRLRNGGDPFQAIAVPFLYQIPVQSDFDDYCIVQYILKTTQNAPIRLPGFVKRLAKVIAKRNTQNKKDENMYNRLDLSAMTLAQLSELAEELTEILDDANFVELYLTKLQPSSDQLSVAAVDPFTPDELLHDYLDKALSFLAKVPSGAEQWKRTAMHKKLILNMYRGNYDSDMFIEFLRLPRRRSSNGIFDRKFGYDRVANSPDFHLVSTHYAKPFLLRSLELDEHALISEYLGVLFIQGVPKSAFQSILDTKSYLDPTYAEAMFTAGKITANECINILGQSQFESLAERQLFEFTSTSKRSKIWYPNDAIDITLRLKNVKDLSIRVFRINMYNYYRENPNLQTVDPNIDLDGLTPIWESYKVNEQHLPTELYEERFTFGGKNGLASSDFEGRGLWVIDFISGRKSCRALIQKGFINCIVRPTVSGQLMTLTDEKNRRIATPYSVWLKGKELESDSEGNIMIPFSDQQGNNSILVKLQNFAQIVERPSLVEDYEFTASFYVNHESLQKENIASVTVIPFLKVGDQRAPLSLLEDVKLSVESTDTHQISSSYKLADVQFTENQPFTNQFRVPADLKDLEFKLEGRIKRCSGGAKYQDVIAFHTVKMDRDDHECTSAYIRTNEDGYTLFVTGKNGEPKRNHVVSIELMHKLIAADIPITLKTNENGEIRLGRLSNITHISLPGIGLDSRIQPDEQINFWPTTICESEETTIKLPFYSGEEYIITLGKTGVDSVLLEDCTDNLSVANGFIEISGLMPGRYKLRCVTTLLVIAVDIFIIRGAQETLKDQFWTSLRLGQRWIVESAGESVFKPLTISDVRIDDQNVSVQLQNWSRKTYALICGNSTLTHRTPHENYMSKKESSQPLVYPVGQGNINSLFVSGRKLSEEYQYILERARFGKWTSTTLQNPSLLLKRQEQSETTVTSKKLKGATAFDSTPKSIYADSFRRSARVQLRCLSSQGHFDLFPANDFLKIANIDTQVAKPDKDGIIHIDKESIGTSNFLSVLVISGDQAVARDIRLFRQLALPTVDLRHFAPVDPGKAIIRAREVTKLAAIDGPVEVCVDQDREVIDSFEKLFSIFKTLQPSDELEKFNFINTWPSQSHDERLIKYNEHACHELNFWLMHKDKIFFKDVVYVALQSKLEKTFLDLYMLDADIGVFATNLHLFESLNLFEKVLLAKRVPGIRDTVHAMISEYLEISPPETSLLQKQFETVIAGTRMSLQRMAAALPMSDIPPMAVPPPPPAATSLFGSGVTRGAHPFLAKVASARKPNAFSAPPPPPPAAPETVQRRMVETESFDQDEDMDPLELESDVSNSEEKALMELRATMKTEHAYQYKDRTKEYRETNYLVNNAFITINEFWLDYLMHDGSSPFLSERFAQASNSFIEQIFALAVIDVPFKGDAKVSSLFVPENNQIMITACTPALVFHRNLKLCEVASNQEKLLVVQNIFNISDHDQQGKRQLVASDDLRNSVEYGMHIVVSNMTAESYVIEVSYQIPIGSIPTRKSKYLDATSVIIEPYTTWQEETSFFYFPNDGQYTNVPVSVTVDGELVARSKLTDILVKQSVDKGVGKDWQTIAAHGTNGEVMAYLKSTNLLKTDLNLIQQRMGSRAFANDVIDVLRDRKFYRYELWVHGIRHNLPLAIKDVLTMELTQLEKVGSYFTSALVDLPKTSSNYFQILDYNPIVKARAHSVGSDKFILNSGFHKQYTRFLEYLSHKREHDATDLLCLGVYLVYQERLVEAHAVREKLKVMIEKGQSVASTVQYDYLNAFLNTRISVESLDSCDEILESSRELAIKYQTYPLLSWRQRFDDIVNIFNDMDGISSTFDDQNEQLTVEQLNVKELNQGPSLDLNVNDAEVIVSCSNLQTIRLKIYALNIEMLFSTNPFISKNSSGNYSLVAANYENDYTVDQCHQATTDDKVHSRAISDDYEIVGTSKPRTSKIKLEIPADLQNRNILVEVQGGGIIQSSAHFSNALNVQVVEKSGLIRVASKITARPSVGSYVKVYVKLFSGEVHFWKDGYTAINGVFDYISATEDNELLGTNWSSLKDIMVKVQKLSILVLSSDAGGLIKVVEPPNNEQYTKSLAMVNKLETLIEEKYVSALQSGNLLFFNTETETKSEGGIEFQIRHAPSLLSKPKADGLEEATSSTDPFEKPHPALHISDLAEHRLLLNKFCVVPHHLLVVTKKFQKQTDPLLPSDLRATWEILTQLPQPSIAFYNCGALSGASQPHKHIQIVPLVKSTNNPPINAVYDHISGRKAGEIYTIKSLPYVHVLVPLDLNFIGTSTDPEELEGYLGQMFFGLFDSMIQQLRENDSEVTFSYNFILTSQYMMMVPRQKEHWEVAEKGIKLSVNSMAFAGLLLTKTSEELDTLKQTNILNLLAEVGVRRREGGASSVQDEVI